MVYMMRILKQKKKEKKMIETGKIINGDCIEVMKTFPEGSIDLVVTSPPYNVNIAYDVHKDDLPMDEYYEWTKDWLREAFRVLKDDGRIAVNVPNELNVQERGGRILFVAEFWMMMKEVGFKFSGLVDLTEDSPHRVRQTAWGSWMSASAPYIYNPKECIILAYKKSNKKLTKGESQWKGVPTDIEQPDGVIKNKMVYQDEDKKEFMNLVFGRWEYFADTRSLTKATFSMDIPSKAIKILTYKNDIVLDPFMGSGTSAFAAELLDRRWLGIELSPDYTEIARKRVQALIDERKQMKLELKEEEV
jgi:site-specific DNA-methyltransferase (adenine-specific)